jgi:agmatine/peptidylarginine deiminase
MVRPVMKHILFLPLFFLSFQIFSQQNLPKGFAEGEKEKMPLYLQSRNLFSNGITTPPDSSVRPMAEWEEVQAVVITWTSYTSILSEIVSYAQEECKVIIICSDSNQVKTKLNSNNVTIKNVGFIEASYNSIWGRDYGGNSVYVNDVDSLIIVDWIYNRPRPYDDASPEKVANYLNIPFYQTTDAPFDLVNTGGNYMTDGFGTAFASKLVLEENEAGATYTITNKDEAMVDSIMEMFMGINRYIKMETLPYDGIHHIDMHMKLVNEETLLVGEYPAGIADGPQIEANLQYVLNNYNSMFGTAYKVKRIVMPPDAGGDYPDDWGDYRTYTNSVILNKTVIVPTYQEKYDTTALRIYRECMPGYNVVGIECNDIIKSSGAIHCITHEVGVDDPLLISHQALSDSYDTVASYTVKAYINHRSGIKTATLYYSTDTANGFQTASMALTDSVNHSWSGSIPSINGNGKVFYYIEASANSGKTQIRPITSPEGSWTFNVSGITGKIKEKDNFISVNRVFPNPASAVTCIELYNEIASKASIRLYDILGNEMETIYEGIIPLGENHYFFDASKLSPGAYIIFIDLGNKKAIEKLMVK